jgi:FAD/FMN-containing dehydrogenase
MTDEPTRRDVLRAATLGLAGLAAGCTGGSGRVLPTPSATPSRPALSSLAGRLTGTLLRPGTAEYAASAKLNNARFDGTTRPLAIARCATPADVAACVRFATDTGTALHVRAGGHSYGGWSSGPGLVVDVRPMAAVHTQGTSARIGAGAPLIRVYSELGRRGVALAAGSCPTVGITGLTLGGGVGVLTTAYGLTCDSLSSVQVVTADGRVREVTEGDLFWALQGGGGSFGVVTAMTFSTRPAPRVHTFYRSWDLDHGEAVLGAWQRWTPTVDRRLWSTCKLLADRETGRTRVLVAGTWIGPASELEGQLDPLLTAIGVPPGASQDHTRSYADAMLFEAGCSGLSATSCAAQALSPPKREPFAASSVILAGPLTEPAMTSAVVGARRALDVPGLVEGGLSFDALGGAVADVGPEATAFPHRQALATVQATATWRHGPPDLFDAYVHDLRSRLVPVTGPSAYSNYADPTITDYGTAYWGANYPRLQSVKRDVDPHDLFSWAQSIKA